MGPEKASWIVHLTCIRKYFYSDGGAHAVFIEIYERFVPNVFCFHPLSFRIVFFSKKIHLFEWRFHSGKHCFLY